MSQSLASAKKRRVPNEPPAIKTQQQQQQQQQQQMQSQAGLTLPQVIQIVDRRLIHLEKVVSDIQENKKEDSSSTEDNSESSLLLKNVVEEFDKRYELLAEEIINLKNIVINLQSFTMEVNKTMVEERRQILSQLSNLEQLNEKSEPVKTNENEPLYNTSSFSVFKMDEPIYENPSSSSLFKMDEPIYEITSPLQEILETIDK